MLLDINLPGTSGIEVCQEIRRVSPGLGVILTVRDSEDDLVNALEAGADDSISKPFHIRELRARLKAAIRGVHALDHLMAHPGMCLTHSRLLRAIWGLNMEINRSICGFLSGNRVEK